MEGFKGTKGKWRVYEYGQEHYTVETDSHIICNTLEGGEEALADAKLMSFSPKLLESLKVAVEIMEHSEVKNSMAGKAFLKRSRSMLKKILK